MRKYISIVLIVISCLGLCGCVNKDKYVSKVTYDALMDNYNEAIQGIADLELEERTLRENLAYETELNTKIDAYLGAMDSDLRSIQIMCGVLKKVGVDASDTLDTIKGNYDIYYTALDASRPIKGEEAKTAIENIDSFYDKWTETVAGFYDIMENSLDK